MDLNVGVTLALRLWNIVAGFLMLIVMQFWFSKIEQGFYYTFASLISIQIFFELGLNYVIMQVVAREMPYLSLDADNKISGPANHLDRLASLLKMLIKWYSLAAIAYFLVTLLVGWIFFIKNSVGNDIQWQKTWFLLVAFSSINLYISPFLAFSEGLGRIASVAFARLLQSIFGYGILWLSLMMGAGLSAIPLISFFSALGGLVYVYKRRNTYIYLMKRPVSNNSGVDWFVEVFPFQWRIAVSWISGYLIYQILSPIFFANNGPVLAGQLGVLFTIFGAAVSLSMSWINSKSPHLAGLIVNNDYEEARRVFKKIFINSTLFNLIVSCLILFTVASIKSRELPFSERLPDVPIIVCVFVNSIFNHWIFSMAMFMRTYKQEPMLPVSIVHGVLSVLSIYFISDKNLLLSLVAYTSATVFVIFPWTIVLFREYFKNTINIVNLRATANS